MALCWGPTKLKKSGSRNNDVIARLDNVIIVKISILWIFLRFWKFLGLIFAELFLKHSQHTPNAITWRCDVIDEKDSNDLALYFAYLLTVKKVGNFLVLSLIVF